MLKLIVLCLAVVIAVRADCPSICTMEYEPVCGVNGRTYGNRCALETSGCEDGAQGVAVEMAYTGECSSDIQIDTEDGPALFEKLMKLEDAEDNKLLRFKADVKEAVNIVLPGQDCGMACAKIYDPVCGDDGTTYPNECELGNANCRFKKSVKVAWKGLCEN